MRLSVYLTSHGLNAVDFAKKIKVSFVTVYRYLHGRIPESPIMKRIIKETGGCVQPGDFFEVTDEPRKRRKKAA